MPQSKRIEVFDAEKLGRVNPETLKLWNKYTIDMSLRELSPNTIEAYKTDLQQWWIYILENQGNQSVTELTEDDITEFLFFCKKNGNNSRRMKRRMSSIAAFYKYLRKKRIITENPMEFIDRPKKDTDVVTQTFLTQEQVELMRTKLQEFVDAETSVARKGYALQMQCYALFSLSTMARVTAVSNTRWEQIDFENRMVNDVVEKEGYIVTLYFSQEVQQLLQNMVEFRKANKIDDCGYVFIDMFGDHNKIDRGSMGAWCKRIGDMIGVPTLHPHDFRHSGSNLLKNAGMDLEDISALLNHSGTDVTVKHYLRVDKNKVQANKDKFKI